MQAYDHAQYPALTLIQLATDRAPQPRRIHSAALQPMPQADSAFGSAYIPALAMSPSPWQHDPV